MFQRELITISFLAAAIFLTVLGAGWFGVRALHETSRQLVVDTLPGLVDAGQAEERMHDNRHLMREMLAAHTAAERARMIESVQTNSTDSLWSDYANSIFETEDAQNFQNAMLARSNYLQGCAQFFTLVTAEKTDQATALFNGELSRRFQAYNAATEKIFDYNVRQGLARGQSILGTARYAPCAIGLLCVLLFVFGLILGLRSALGGTSKPPGRG